MVSLLFDDEALVARHEVVKVKPIEQLLELRADAVAHLTLLERFQTQVEHMALALEVGDNGAQLLVVRSLVGGGGDRRNSVAAGCVGTPLIDFA